MGDGQKGKPALNGESDFNGTTEARRDERLRARFQTYRLNLPTRDDNSELIAAHDWERMLTREVPERSEAAVLGLDLGASWSAATVMFRNGRTEIFCSVPGVPSFFKQERRDGDVFDIGVPL